MYWELRFHSLLTLLLHWQDSCKTISCQNSSSIIKIPKIWTKMHWECSDVTQSSGLHKTATNLQHRPGTCCPSAKPLTCQSCWHKNFQHWNDTVVGRHVSIGDNLGWSNHWSQEAPPAFYNTYLAHLHTPHPYFILSTVSTKCPTKALGASPFVSSGLARIPATEAPHVPQGVQTQQDFSLLG